MSIAHYASGGTNSQHITIMPLAERKSINMRPLQGRFSYPDPGGVTCLLTILAPGGTIYPISHYAPGGKNVLLFHLASGGKSPINMRPLQGRFS